MFTQLSLRDFRGFNELELSDLARVNLIVGRNNSGKTSLLEGIAMLCYPRRVNIDLPGLLRAHPGNIEERYLRWVVRDGSTMEAELRGEIGGVPRSVWMAGTGPTSPAQLSEGRSEVLSSRRLRVAETPGLTEVRCRVVSAHQRDPQSLVQLFDRAMIRRGGEETIERLLKEVDPRVRRIRIRAPDGQSPFIEVDLGLSERIPLTQVGQGMSRLVSIVSELLGEAPQVCLIDEIENGIHHSLLPQIWRGLAAAAREIDIQIFATTHSYECIVAAHESFADHSSYDFRIIQLFRYDSDQPKGIQGRVLDQNLIEAAIRGEVDLR